MRPLPISLLLGLAILLPACGGSPFGLRPPSGGGGSGGGGGDGGGGGGTGGRYHPDGWAEPAAHGLALKLQNEDCRGCHGDDLATGGTAGVGCDSCHPSGWRQDCVFCHGGQNDTSGAPPRGITGSTTARFFPAHGAHLSGPRHPAYTCEQCHAKPTDVLSAGHVFDPTPGRAEVTFAQGLSAGGSYADAACSNLYCHGDGRGANGSVRTDASSLGCASCHAGATSGGDAWDRMSGEHKKHLEQGFGCVECHATVVSAAGTSITDDSLHVNGQPDISLSTDTISYSSGSCTGICHLKLHVSQAWR